MEPTKNKRILTKRELRNELFGILAMINGFHDGDVGGQRQQEMIRFLPHQIAIRLMQLQDLIEECELDNGHIIIGGAGGAGIQRK